ncbi:MAG TPA: AAA family ATPase [Gammaproteobacteria bacterium]|nr:AAA family ATPase [Gammaproteobacteria bacterium]
MRTLALNFLGDLTIARDGERLELPPSRKTRALLAYLALTGKPFRREHLCELLWEIPDDPRGSLRWSLSKLRRLVDDEARERIVADRLTVRFDATGVGVDVAALATIAHGKLDEAPLAELEEAAARYCGTPLEGLDLPTFHDYSAWYMGERERATANQARVLNALLKRLAGDPQRAVEHARTLVRIAPYDEKVRATLIRLLMTLGRPDQAEQHYQMGSRLLKEAGATPTGELFRAWRGAPGAAAAAPAPAASAAPAGRPARPAPTARDGGSAANAGRNLRPGARSAQDSKGAVEPRLIGRDAELERLRVAMTAAFETRRCRTVLLVGEPGIGKSRLLDAAAALARDAGALVLEAAAYEAESIRPFALFVDALRKLEPAAAAAVFDRGDSSNRDRLFERLAELVAERAGTQPVVLKFDDLQWSDESSAAALHYVVRTSENLGLLVLLAARRDELRDNTPILRAVRELRHAALLEEIDLAALGEHAVREIIGARAPQADAERLCKECGGNPLLAIELARAEAAGESGQSLREVIQERLARFDADGGEVLRWAAVLSPRIDAASLARLTGLDWNAIGEALETAARHSMLVQAERGLRFSHELIARSIYAGIPPARRRTMHRRVAELLEQDTALEPERAADLAHHAAQSADAALAARAMISAARLCLRFFANDEASALAGKGLQWVEQLTGAAERVCLTLELREVLATAAPVADWEAAAREFAALAEQALDHGALSHARRGYFMASYMHWAHGRFASAREEILQSERVARSGDDEEHIVGMAEAARCLAMLERDLTHADAMLMEAQALAARKGMTHNAIPAALGMLRFHENKLDESVELFKQARTLARASGDRLDEFQANEYLAMIDLERGRPADARIHCKTLVDLGDKLREGSERPFAHALDGLCHYALSDDTAPLDAALADLRSADAKHRLAYTLTRAALLDVDRQRPEAAIARATEALGYAEALDRATEIVLAHAALARARKALADTAGYAKHVAELKSLEPKSVARWALDRALAVATQAE